MNYLSNLTELINAFRAETRQDAITPDSLGSLLQRMVDTLRKAWGAANHPYYHIECDTKSGRLIVKHPTDLMEKGYVPYLLRYSKKKPRYRDYESRTRSRGPLMRGWHLFHDENLPIVAKILLRTCGIRDFFLSLHYQNLPIVAKISNCMVEIKRDRYLLKLIESRHNGFIKVITGIRRCGKSYLL